MLEAMPYPPRRDSDFPEWLGPARNNIRHELSRIKQLLAAPPLTSDAIQRSRDEDQLNLVLGAAYSLRKPVFQDGHHVDHGAVMNTARDFVDEIVRGDGAISDTEMSAWSLGYYLSGARLRLSDAVQLWKPNHPGIPSYVSQPLGSNFFEGYRLISADPTQPRFTPLGWVKCYHVLSHLLSYCESRARLAQEQAATLMGNGSTDPMPDEPPLVVRYGDDILAVYHGRYMTSSFVDGKWYPGYVLDRKDFTERSQISEPEIRDRLLREASEAREAFRIPYPLPTRWGMPEAMPLPRHDTDFSDWLIPARNNIQNEFLRIKKLLAAFPQTPDAAQQSLDNQDRLNLLLAAAYSLWRAVVQGGHRLDQGEVMSTAREFVDGILCNSAATGGTKLNDWVLGYYLDDARRRLIRLIQLWPDDLGCALSGSSNMLRSGANQPRFTPSTWVRCFEVLHYLLVFYESKTEYSGEEITARSGQI